MTIQSAEPYPLMKVNIMQSVLKLIFAAMLTFMLPGAAVAKEGTVAPLSSIPKGAEVVTVGFYPLNIYGVDPANSTFNFDGYIWFRWKGAIDPTSSVEFTNAVDKSSLTKQFLYEKPQIAPDGSRYQIMRIESAFLKPFSLADFPLDKHDLSITLEDSLSGVDRLVYEIDRQDTSYAPGLAISGWNLNNWSSSQTLVDYASAFGDRGASQASRFARITFALNISRPESYFYWKLFLPLIVVVSGAWIALLLNPALTETRAALPASALLTTVFLQQGYSSTLPETGGLVLLDEIYVVAYVLIVATLIHVIIQSRNIEEKTEAELSVLKKKEVRTLVIQAAIFFGSALAIVLLR